MRDRTTPNGGLIHSFRVLADCVSFDPSAEQGACEYQQFLRCRNEFLVNCDPPVPPRASFRITGSIGFRQRPQKEQSCIVNNGGSRPMKRGVLPNRTSAWIPGCGDRENAYLHARVASPRSGKAPRKNRRIFERRFGQWVGPASRVHKAGGCRTGRGVIYQLQAKAGLL